MKYEPENEHMSPDVNVNMIVARKYLTKVTSMTLLQVLLQHNLT